MPTPQEILDVLDRAADEWIWLAIAWHAVAGGAFCAVVAGWRPSTRLAGLLLPLPLLTVAVVAGLAGNPFNLIVPVVLAVVLAVLALRLRRCAIEFGPLWSIVAGAFLAMFGLIYPHFLDAGAAAYLYAAPTGIVPCPTLSLVIGLALILNGLRSASYSAVLGAGGVFYGLFGAFRLGVRIDLILAVGGGLLIAMTLRNHGRGEP